MTIGGSALALGMLVAAPSFAALESQAEPIGNLGRFLEKYIGDCASDDPEFDRAQCEARAARTRATHKGRAYVLEVDDLDGVLRFAKWDKRKKAFRLHLTPFFQGRTFALTIGKPRVGKRRGLPVVSNLPIWVKLPDGEPEFIFRRTLERAQVRLKLVVELGRPWSLPRRGEKGLYRGVQAKLRGLRLVGSRSDRVLAEQTY